MLVGYNTNVPYKGTIYHVQTEDNGMKNPVIVTLLYLKGTILASKKVNYGHVTSSPDHKEKIRELMKEQHKNMIKELIAGKHAAAAEAAPEAEGGPPDQGPAEDSPEQRDEPKGRTAKSLDDILLDYIIRRNE
jgi:hypothetical protein